MRIKKVLGILKVAPDNPAMDVRVKSSAFEKEKPRLSICTDIIPHINQIANPQRRLGIEIQRFRVAIFFPVDSQNLSSSTFHSNKLPLPSVGFSKSRFLYNADKNVKSGKLIFF